MTHPIRVLIVDDSAVVRGLMSRWIEDADDIEITGFASNGEQALQQLASADPDIVLLDIEMPILDGLTVLPQIRKEQPNAKIIMVSSLTVRHARETFKALANGASDYLPKPSADGQAMSSSGFQKGLLEKIRALAPQRKFEKSTDTEKLPKRITPKLGVLKPSPHPSLTNPEIMVIGGSTGGPQALFTLFENEFTLAHDLPVLITQHMPPTFTTIFAKHLQSVSGLPAKEAEEGETPKPGYLYIAPGGYHLSVRRAAGRAILSLDQGPMINFCRPAVDRLFLTAADTYGAATLAIVLTGMGQDGCAGAHKIAENGGMVIIQDEASSVVWGMPGAVAEAGIEMAQFPIDKMAAGLKAFLNRQFPAPHFRSAMGGKQV